MDERTKCTYNNDELLDIDDEKAIILREIKKNNRHHSPIYPNQEHTGNQVAETFNDRKKIIVMVIALTQSGKTGTMISVIKNYISKNIIPIDNIYIITGYSSKEWKNQTNKRMPNSLEKRIYHRDNLLQNNSSFVSDIKNKSNVLIIIDEIHIAAKDKQTLYNVFDNIGIYDIKNILRRDIKVVEFTATPNGTIYDLRRWGDRQKVIKMLPGYNYMSCFDLVDNKRVYQYKDLECYDKKTQKINESLAKQNITEIKNIIDNNYKNDPLYHIIRTPTSTRADNVKLNFEKVFGNDVEIHTYDEKSDINDINTIISTKPDDHEFIFIKEKLRCAKTLNKQNIGILYERFTHSPDDSTIIQGLIGRGTGYDDNKKSVYFTNLESIERYKIHWESNFASNTDTPWTSNTTRFDKKDNKNKSSGTVNNPESKDKDIIINKNSIFMEFKSFDNACSYKELYMENNNKYAFQSARKNKNGFYENNIRGITKVMTYENVKNDYGWGLNETTKFRLHRCYRDINDKKSLVYIVSHKPLIVIEKFNTEKAVKNYCKKRNIDIKTTHKNADGFYENTIGTLKRVMDSKEVKNDIGFDLYNNKKCKLLYYYKNKTDNTSSRFKIIHYELPKHINNTD